jgi:hypothetical protein
MCGASAWLTAATVLQAGLHRGVDGRHLPGDPVVYELRCSSCHQHVGVLPARAAAIISHWVNQGRVGCPVLRCRGAAVTSLLAVPQATSAASRRTVFPATERKNEHANID